MDQSDVKQEQRKNWNGLASAWDTWGDAFELGASHVNAELFKLAGVKSGDKVLDIATGIGEPALSAGKIVGASGSVVGIDIAEEMISIARVRGNHSSNVKFIAADAGSYQFEADYDVVLSRFGFMFMPDYQEVFKKINGSLKKDGVLAFSVWDTPDKAPMISLAVGFFGKELQLPSPPKNNPNPFSMADTDMVGAKLEALGFKEISFNRIDVPFHFQSVDHYLGFSRDLIPKSINKMISEIADKEKIDALWKKFEEILEKRKEADESIFLKSTAICWRAIKS